jgi:hypothetical protein
MKILFFFCLIVIMSAHSCSYKKSRIKALSDISLPPVSTFEKSCSHCHGYEGSAYGESFRDIKDKALRSEIEEMMFYKAGLNPDSIEVDAMIAYTISLKNNEPFAIIVNSKSFLQGKVSNLIIETSPDTKLEVHDNSARIIENWNIKELFYDPAKIKKIEIHVKRNDASSSFDFPDELCVQQ